LLCLPFPSFLFSVRNYKNSCQNFNMRVHIQDLDLGLFWKIGCSGMHRAYIPCPKSNLWEAVAVTSRWCLLCQLVAVYSSPSYP
jgi:hypothetical protein